VRISGEVSSFAESSWERGQGDFQQIWKKWDFVLNEYDDAGNLARSTPVQMTGRSFDGRIRDKDKLEIELASSWRQGTTAQIAELRNLTTGVTIRAEKEKLHRAAALVVMLLVLAIFGFAAFWILRSFFDGWHAL
jgi:hypothetical protein